MRNPRAIRSLSFLLAAVNLALQPFSAFCNQPAPATPEKESQQDAAQDSKNQHPVEKLPPERASEDNPKQPSPLSIPFIEGYDSLDLKIPDFDSTTGAMKSFFSIGVLRRLDDRHVEIRQSFLGLYKPDGSMDLSVDITKASLDRFTRQISSRVPVIIWSDEFQITGATMELDTVSKEAKLSGPVRVLLYKAKGDDDGLETSGPTEQTGASLTEPQKGQSPDATGVEKNQIK